MRAQVLTIIDGPDKPSLQYAIAHPDTHRVYFRLDDDGINAEIAHMEEQIDGVSFQLEGVVQSGELQGSPFRGLYSVGERKGTFTVKRGM